MIKAFIKEIRESLDKEMYMSALTLTLILPDMCGQVEYSGEKPKERYIKWFDNFVASSMRHRYDDDKIPYVSGQIAWDLRNNVIHGGDPDVNSKESDIQDFKLLVQEKGRSAYAGTSTCVMTKIINGQEIVEHRSITIALRDFCNTVCCCVNAYYKKNIDKFTFKYKVVNIDDMSAKLMVGVKREVYKKDEENEG
ncbi:MAG: hypothetical protein IJ837_03550 [Clostridia bacterium]|nr:hypothetical protein [Clostridia bacterium]